MSYTNMGIILYRLDNYDKASEYFDKARGCFQNLSIQWGRAKEEAYSALLELKLGKSKSALARYKAACKYADKDYSPNTLLMLQTVYAPAAGSARDSNLRNLRGSLSRQNNDNRKENQS